MAGRGRPRKVVAPVPEPDTRLAKKRTKEEGVAVQQELATIAGEAKIIYPAAVVDAARDPQSILHEFFTWDDSIAAEKFRLEQARLLIGSFRINIPERNIRVQAFTSLNSDRYRGGGYRFIGDVMEAPDLKSQLISQALKELESVQKRYENLEELGQVWGAVEEVRESIEPVADKTPKRQKKIVAPEQPTTSGFRVEPVTE